MEQETNNLETPENSEASAVDLGLPRKGGINMKVILFGLPLFVLQLIVVYFVTANILLNKVQGNSTAQQTVEQTAPAKGNQNTDAAKAQQKTVLGKFIHSVDDIIVNPAGTNGEQLLLTSIAFDLANQEGIKELKDKEIIVKDMIISVLSSKNITQLSNTAYKDTLRTEISKKLQVNMPQVKVNKVYFSKYIIQ